MTAPDAPREAEVRALLERHLREMELAVDSARLLRVDDALWRENAALYRAALALLDAGRKDRERVDKLVELLADQKIEIHQESNGVTLYAGPWVPDMDTGREDAAVEITADSLRAAIDQASGA